MIMRLIVFAMKRYKILLVIIAGLVSINGFGQYKYEREFRIKKSQFPAKAHALIEDQLAEARRIRYYKETDSTKISYEAKFKVDRLHYSVEFNQEGELEDVEILIKKVDIPNDSFKNMTDYLDNNFNKYRIRRIQQQYPVSAFESVEQTIKNAFQNLLLPTIRYELMVAGKKNNGFEDFEILFDADGSFLKMRKSLPVNYDHILY